MPASDVHTTAPAHTQRRREIWFCSVLTRIKYPFLQLHKIFARIKSDYSRIERVMVLTSLVWRKQSSTSAPEGEKL